MTNNTSSSYGNRHLDRMAKLSPILKDYSNSRVKLDDAITYLQTLSIEERSKEIEALINSCSDYYIQSEIALYAVERHEYVTKPVQLMLLEWGFENFKENRLMDLYTSYTLTERFIPFAARNRHLTPWIVYHWFFRSPLNGTLLLQAMAPSHRNIEFFRDMLTVAVTQKRFDDVSPLFAPFLRELLDVGEDLPDSWVVKVFWSQYGDM